MSDTLKISLAFAVSLVVMILAAGRWQGGVDTTLTMLFEKATTNRSDVRDLQEDLEQLEERVSRHLEKTCN